MTRFLKTLYNLHPGIKGGKRVGKEKNGNMQAYHYGKT
jgi:hypothetical protein